MDYLLLNVLTLRGLGATRSGVGVASLLVVFLGLASGCGSGGSSEASSGADRPGGPVDVLLLGRDSPATNAFIERSISDCMSQSGFDYEPRPLREFKSPDTREFREGHGFGFADGEGGPIIEEVAYEAGKPRTEAWTSRFETCDATAHEVVSDRLGAYVASLDGESRALFDAVADFSHPMMVEASESWAACMRSDGHDFASPAEMYQYLQRSVTGSSSLDDEIEIAVADWDCSHISEVKDKVESAYAELNSRLAASFEGVFDVG